MRTFFLTFLILIFGCASMQVSFANNTSTKLNDPKMIIDTKKWNAKFDDPENQRAGTGGVTTPLTCNDKDKNKDGKCIANASGNSEQTTNQLLTSIMTKLMIGISLVTVLLIVIGGGCLIFSGGSDSLKTKGKNILIAGILSLSVAMCSAIIINVVGYILYGASK